jgi:hypothetical protein
MAWLAGWTRRKSKVVNNPVTDYQMKLICHKGLGTDSSTDIYLDGHVKDDFADLRFTGPDQVTPLDYWIESIISGVATVWIKIPTLVPVNNIYIYYDNPIATSSSNGPNTFDFFDDFSGTTYDAGKWNLTGVVTVANSILTVQGGAPNGLLTINAVSREYTITEALLKTDHFNSSSFVEWFGDLHNNNRVYSSVCNFTVT